jgi:sterol 24-C-methyltransferase
MWTKQWVLTDAYDDTNADHRRWVAAIRQGNSLPAPIHARDVDRVVREAGFTVVVHSSTATELAGSASGSASGSAGVRPWWTSLEETSATRLTCRPSMRACTNAVLGALETTRCIPAGLHQMSTDLNTGADGLAAAGRAGVYDVSYVYVLEKPTE